MTLKEQILNQFSNLNIADNQHFDEFIKNGFPTVKNEEWKYTSVKEIVDLEYNFQTASEVSIQEIENHFLHAASDNYLVFVNGKFEEKFSKINSNFIKIEDDFIDSKNYKKYNQDGFIDLNDSFNPKSTSIIVQKNKIVANPVYIYYFNQTSAGNSFALPKLNVHLEENSQAIFVEFFVKLGQNVALTDAITEFNIEENAVGTYYKILNEGIDANHVGTTQINQNGKSVFNATTIVLGGNIVRNNLNISLNKAYSETHMYGLNMLTGNTHVDNHTVVDHALPHCESNELYKAILDEKSSSVFNGKIFVRQDAQKTNAYQSSKNILLSNEASANSKPQLEIWADDVKCSHGHATGQLNKDHVFYLKARGIGEKEAMRMLTQAYAQDVLNNIKIESLRHYCESEIAKRF